MMNCLELLKEYPDAQLVVETKDDLGNPCVLIVMDETATKAYSFPDQIEGKPVKVEYSEPYKPALLYESDYASMDFGSEVQSFQACHNAPVPGGVQIQPNGANWVGTLGCLVKYRVNGEVKYGGLSNWHVIGPTRGRTVHQPVSSRPSIGTVELLSTMRSGQAHFTDAGIFDCKTPNGYSLDRKQWGYSRPLASQHRDARVGDQAAKCGRTTGFVRGTCVGTGAASRVNFGAQGVLLFNDQDVYRGTGGTMSAPGDSGSLIFDPRDGTPLSLLFAGGGGTTIANPLRYIVREFNVSFDI
jgi:hypothetical protein